MKVLVTGGAGYLGSVLCQQLVASHHQVRVLDKGYWGYDHLRKAARGVEIVPKDVREVESIDLDGIDAVVHLAGLSNDPTAEFHPEANLEVTVKASKRLWDCCAAESRPIKVVCASTASLYDGSVEAEATETADASQLCMNYPYSEAKYLAEKSLFECANHPWNKISAVVLRMATLWGWSPRMRTDLAINAMVLSALQNGKITVHCDGMQWRPMCHVQDAAAAYVAMLDAPSVHGNIFNVVSDNWVLLDLAHRVSSLVEERVKVSIPVIVTYGKERRRSYRVSGDRLRTKTSWLPAVDLRLGVTQIINEWKEHGYPEILQSTNMAWMEHLLALDPFFRRNKEVL